MRLSQQLLTLQQSHHDTIRQVLVAAGSMLSVWYRVCNPIKNVAMGPAGTVLSLACSAACVPDAVAAM